MTDRSNKWGLVLIPDHQGVMNVGGRLGAAEGPAAFKQMLARLKGRDPVLKSLGSETLVSELGKDVAQNHEQAAQAVEKAQAYPFTIVVGGGHDHGYSHLLGVRRALVSQSAGVRIGCINIDAHLDVRRPSPEISSGSPFYLAIESGVLNPAHFVEFGIQNHCNAPELWDYVEGKSVKVVGFEELRHGRAVSSFQDLLENLATQCDSIVISLDLDAATGTDAPGVSAPQAEGFTSSEIIEICEIAGRHPQVCSLGIFELNPIHDLDFRTARLAATSAYHFVACALGR